MEMHVLFLSNTKIKFTMNVLQLQTMEFHGVVLQEVGGIVRNLVKVI